MTRYKTNKTNTEIGDIIQINEDVTAVKILPFTFILIECPYSYKVGKLNAHSKLPQAWFSVFSNLLKYD